MIRVDDSALNEARKKASAYEWDQAAALCRQELVKVPRENSLQVASITGFEGRCHFQSAFQSRNTDEFRQKMSLSKIAYDASSDAFRAVGLDGHRRKAEGQARFAQFWSNSNQEERVRELDKCIKTGREATRVFEEEGDAESLASARLDLLAYLREMLYLSRSWTELKPHFDEAIELSRVSIKESEKIGEREELLELLHSIIWFLTVEASPLIKPKEFQLLSEEAKECERKMTAISEKNPSARARCLLNESRGNIASNFDGDPPKAVSLYTEALQAARQTRDSFRTGIILWLTAQEYTWVGMTKGYSAERQVALKQALDSASESRLSLEISSHPAFMAATYATSGKALTELASQEADPSTRIQLLREAVEVTSRGTMYETGTWSWKQAGHELSKALYTLALSEPDHGENKRLLTKALSIREATASLAEQLLPPGSWDSVIMLNYLSLVKSEIAETEFNPTVRASLLDDAVSTMKTCVDVGREWGENPAYNQILARHCEWYGDILAQLTRLRGESSMSERSVNAYLEAAKFLEASRPAMPLASLKWKIARVHDGIGDFERAATSFREARDDYDRMAKQFPDGSSTFTRLARHMDAWALVEQARQMHAEENFAESCKAYRDAATSFLRTDTWSFLSKLASARSVLEKAEELYREPKGVTSSKLFAEAADMFREAANELEARSAKERGPREIREMQYWIRTAVEREDYCNARILLDEAMHLDKNGEKSRSAKKYQLASDALETLAGRSSNSQDRIELELLAKFCNALARMKDAEARVSPPLYLEAAELFNQVKESSPGDKFRRLALANSYICRALEAGTRFRLTRDPLLYPEVKRHLETAADYYQEAEYKNAAIWTRATQRLFDSLFDLTAGETEVDPKKKRELYDSAEKQLESAAALYGKAGFSESKAQTIKHLLRARETKDILDKSIETLAEMPTTSGTLFAPLSLAGTEALGLERFEEANVVSNISLTTREVPLTSRFEFEVDLTNVGRTTATLVRMENVVPSGFTVEKEDGVNGWLDSTIDLKGRRLEYLKTLKMKIALRPTKTGSFELRPRVGFIDEKGNYRSYEGWKETIAVHKTETVDTQPRFLPSVPSALIIPAEFRFEAERSRTIFEYLVKEFMKDYMTKRLYVEKAGWRSLMDITRDLKLPRSVVYPPRGARGRALTDLEKRGLVESRIFPGERGRGGDITKVRVAYENGIVKRLLDRLVMTDER